ncbi:hypothetical protein AOL_s00006g545 [Orbilia oligospora ATCC 24927]|uniref:Uncharacterized protein n=1 Tax=Arthrobotrys oligospora (strain ATCC 24927 / CBS 115.81 / DSM 1491) TaxID=756982 RepID=G1X0Z4_ARTOA|nr:hypothetical protein AOL_s00006g545 [Orbilia oligospora ATCC 24927]EGX53167.1 hypothetical protein AOL_s00006g545 [Orbilia oligospora ATCC 24927]
MNSIVRVEPNSVETLSDLPLETKVADVKVTSNIDVPTDMAPIPLQRFYLRALLLMFAPIFVTVFYLIIWRFYMVPADADVKFSTADHHIWFYYAWFVVGVFGLNWSRDGLVGVEVAMLQTKLWQALDNKELMMHRETRWSGPAGWIYWICHIPSRKRLWILLSFVSILVFVGLPLSGLSFEITDGFIKSSTPPLVIGRTKENLYDRKPQDSFDLLVNSWKIGSFPIVPGYGILYTPKDVLRSDYENLNSFPNTLPFSKSMPEVFLAPQAKYPIGGKPWGLRASYNCSIVQDASTFTILNERPLSSLYVNQNDFQRASGEITWATFQTESGNSISSFIALPETGPGSNLWGYIEIGRSQVLANERGPESSRNGTDPFYNDQRGILEYALWQIRRKNSYNETEYRPNYKFNDKLETTIRGMPSPALQLDNGTWIWNTTFFQVNKINNTDNLVDGTLDIREYLKADIYSPLDGPVGWIQSVADPIGVRCEYTSAVGTADLEPMSSSFSSFTREPPMWGETQYLNHPLGTSVADVMAARYFELFTSTGSPLPVVISNFPAYETYIQPQVLLKSTMLVFGLDALRIMYDSANGFEGGRSDDNLTSSREGKLITQGVIHPYIPLILFSSWTLLCFSLATSYGFRRRLSDKLDEYSQAQLSKEFKNRLA